MNLTPLSYIVQDESLQKQLKKILLFTVQDFLDLQQKTQNFKNERFLQRIDLTLEKLQEIGLLISQYQPKLPSNPKGKSLQVKLSQDKLTMYSRALN